MRALTDDEVRMRRQDLTREIRARRKAGRSVDLSWITEHRDLQREEQRRRMQQLRRQRQAAHLP